MIYSREESAEDRRLLLWQRRLTVWVLSLVTIFLVFQIGSYFADILTILGISILLSYLFINVVDFITRFVRFRAVAILIVYAILGVITVFSAVLLVPSMVYQITQMLQNIFNHLPDFIQFLNKGLSPLEARLQSAQIQIRTQDIMSSIAGSLPKPDPSALFNKLTDITLSTMTGLVYTISIFVVSFYFLLEGRRMKDAVISLFPVRYRQSLQALAIDMDNSLQHFFAGQVLLALVAGVVMLGIYLALGINYALLLSAFLAFWEIIPVIGPPIGFIPTIVSVAIDGMNIPGNRIIQVLAITAIFWVLQNLKDNVIAPKYIGNVIGVHPILIFVAIMIGARIDGFMGVIFALPVACVINVLFDHLPLKPTDIVEAPAVLQDTSDSGGPPGTISSAQTLTND